ncbi:uncharacterized protein LOC100825179 [Brachypodium distachyon]|uniref:Uncharacterized protein n=1 Tax=Brachypodium distachyon TaxID=15368 RepID=A0A0Q3P3K3_BRADI|nr:uncharacterized protein LOC100825179 [Brachypodium distachyon]KQJ83361.1 hypothetical protein BRADI_5g14513v3 [Brachypodium distachyon]|eukprot:XP_010240069.2 uncharacterized protein LOC100825179 [Brachypodium distachyon]
MFLHSLLLQNMAKNTPQATEARSKDGGTAKARGLSKKSPWYQRAVELLLLIWKQPATGASATTTKAAAAAGVSSSSGTNGKAGGKLRKSSSLNVAASFTRVCLCAPISSYNEQSLYFQAGGDAAAPRRSYSYPRASSASASASGCNSNNSPLVAPPPRAEPQREKTAAGAARLQRPVFRGKSLTDDILMRRFVVDEGATRRRNEMDVIRRRHAAAAKRRRLGPSPLRRMALPESEAEAEEEVAAPETQPKRKGNGQSLSSAVALLA